MNNGVRDGHGKVIGYRCFQCGGVFQQMWDCTCNGCRKQNELLAAIKEQNRLLAELSKSNNPGE